MDEKRHPYDQLAADVAARQRGLVTRRQLLEAGVPPRTIDRHAERGRLHPVFRGVYLVGHPVPPPLARELAALLACGPSAVLSHHTAAALWRVLPAGDGPIHVIVPDRRCRPRSGLRPHHSPLSPDDLRVRHGLRLTSPVRTLRDLRPFLDPATLERAVNEAQVLQLATPRELGLDPDSRLTTRSEAERRLLRLLRRARLSPTGTNLRVGGHRVDVLFADARLVLEVDGYAFHKTRAAFETDRRRDADLAASGYRVLRLTWNQMTREPEAVVARIAAALAHG